MLKLIQDITLEVSKPNLFQAIVAKQNDYGSRFLKVTFVNNGEKIEINPALYATINATRPDGLSKKFDSTINEDGTVTAPLTSWILEMPGMVTCDISVMTDTGKLTSTDFSINVNTAACTDDDVSEDENHDVLIDLINEVEALEQEIEEKIANGEFKGDKGDPGAIHFTVVAELPTENVDESAIYMKPSDAPEEKNAYDEYIYVDGVWECIGTTSVAVDLTDYVKNTDYVTLNKAGLCQIDETKGITASSRGNLIIVKATENDIAQKKNEYKPIVPANLKIAVKSVTYDKTEIDNKLNDVVNTVLQNFIDVSEVGQ